MSISRKIRIISSSIDLKALLALGVFIAMLGSVLEFASDVIEGDTQDVDEKILLLLRSPSDLSDMIGPPWLAEAMRDLTALGSMSVLTLVTGTAILALLMAGRYLAGFYIFGGIVLGSSVNSLLKDLYGRTRPDIVPHLTTVTSESFPSGHSMMSAIVFLTIGSLLATMVAKRKLKVFIILAAFLFTFIVGISRIFLGVHYPSDVIGGWAFGLAWGMLMGVLLRFRFFFKGKNKVPT